MERDKNHKFKNNYNKAGSLISCPGLSLSLVQDPCEWEMAAHFPQYSTYMSAAFHLHLPVFLDTGHIACFRGKKQKPWL